VKRLSNLACEGRGPAVRKFPTGAVRYEWSELEAWTKRPYGSKAAGWHGLSSPRFTMYYGSGAAGWKGAPTIGWGWGGFSVVF
jgi:hypothetical protein